MASAGAAAPTTSSSSTPTPTPTNGSTTPSPHSARDYECPVCQMYYSVPKMLPCMHLACRKCVMTLLAKGDEHGCPVCRAAIRPLSRLPVASPHPHHPPSSAPSPSPSPSPSSASAGQGHGGPSDLSALVDSLPTDLATVALVESHRVLTEPHLCAVCENGTPAAAFCLQCDAKLCLRCAQGHTKLPALRNHVTEELRSLTPQRLAAYYLSTCKAHEDRKAEFYCSSHHELICLLCSSTEHRGCAEVKGIGEMAREKRGELQQRAHRLREKETSLTAQIREVKDRFKVVRKRAKETFDELQQVVKQRRLEVSALIQAEEDAIMTALSQLERTRSAVKSNAGTVEKLVAKAPDVALLDMLSQLASRLDDLELQAGNTDRIGTLVEITFEPSKLNQLRSVVSVLGRVASKKKPRLASAKTNP